MDEHFKMALLVNAVCNASDSSSSNESDEFEEFLAVLPILQREESHKVENFVQNVVEHYTNREFKRHFRVERTTFEKLSRDFLNSEAFPKYAWHGGRERIPVSHYILIFLWYAGNKASMREVAHLFGIAESATFKIINIVMEYLVSISPRIIHFPESHQEKESLAESFYCLAGFPGVIGCIDGSYIPIRTPAHKIRSTYVNRHDHISVTLQAICDSKRKFLDVFTGAPSKIHDSRILKLSPISEQLQTICEGRFHVLGDAAYSIREWLLTPYRHFENLCKEKKKYNEKFSATRVLIENAFGILKKRFIQLIRIDMLDIDKINKFIISCCVLHNLCIDADDRFGEDEDEAEDEGGDGNQQPAAQAHENNSQREKHFRRLGELKRDDICKNL